MKKLNEKEMEQVAGGTGNMSSDEIYSHQGNQVSTYDLWEGNRYIIKSGTYLMIGRLIRSYESDPALYGNTEHKNVFEIIAQKENGLNSTDYVGKIREFGDGTAYFEYID